MRPADFDLCLLFLGGTTGAGFLMTPSEGGRVKTVPSVWEWPFLRGMPEAKPLAAASREKGVWLLVGGVLSLVIVGGLVLWSLCVPGPLPGTTAGAGPLPGAGGGLLPGDCRGRLFSGECRGGLLPGAGGGLLSCVGPCAGALPGTGAAACACCHWGAVGLVMVRVVGLVMEEA